MLLNSPREITVEPGSTRALKHLAMRQGIARKRRSHHEVLQLVFDSLRNRQADGLRNGFHNRRHVLYRLGKISIEMRLEPALDSQKMNITGQISLGKGEFELSGIVVAVTSPCTKLAETQTNQFGEFQIDYLPEKGLSVTFETVAGRDLRITLDDEELGRGGKSK